MNQFGVPKPTKGYVDFQLHQSQVKPDFANGGVKHSVAKDYLTTFRRVDPKTKQTVQVSYSETPPIKNAKTDRMEYTPKRLTFEGFCMKFDANQDLEKYAYTYVYPKNQESPFRKKNEEVKFYVFNPEYVAKKQNKFDDVLTDALTYVKEAAIDELRMKGKGMGMSFTDKGEEEIRSDMRQKAKANPTNFLKQVNSESNEWRGRVQDAIDTGIFETKIVNQMPRWYWGKGEFAGKEICIIDKGANQFEFLLSHMLTDWDTFYHGLGRVQSKDSNEKNLEQKLQSAKAPKLPEDKFREVINTLQSKGKIFYNPLEKTVKYVKAGKEAGLIATVAEGETWQEAVEKVSEVDKSIKLGLNGMFNLSK